MNTPVSETWRRRPTARNGRYSLSVANRGNVWFALEASGTAAHGPIIGDDGSDRLTGTVAQLRSESGFGTQTAHGTDEYTTTEALTRNAVGYGTLLALYERPTTLET